MLKDDIYMAQQIVMGNKGKDNEKIFHNNSFIYKLTNENLTEIIKYFKDKNSILTVTASGDQILNAILSGVKSIDSFDISRFPKYFYELKSAAIKEIDKGDFLRFFCGDITDDFIADELYDNIRKSLDNENELFWDSLFNFFDYSELLTSPLFSNEPTRVKNVIKNNPYLQEDNYYKLREFLADINIKHYNVDISEIKDINTEYELIYLSNILAYINRNKYINILEEISDKKRSELISYSYNLDRIDEKVFVKERFKNSNSGVAIFRR